jgi:hypothetical protein
MSELQSVSDQYVEHIFYFVDVSLLKFLIILTGIYAAVTLPLIILTDIVLCNITLVINMLNIYSYMLLLHCLYCQFNMRCNELLSVQSESSGISGYYVTLGPQTNSVVESKIVTELDQAKPAMVYIDSGNTTT